MTVEIWPVIATVIAAALALAGLIHNGQKTLAQRIDDLGKRIDDQGTTLGTRIEEQGAALNKRIDDLSHQFDKRMDGMDKRIDDLGQQIAAVDSRLRVVEHDQAELKGHVQGLSEALLRRDAA